MAFHYGTPHPRYVLLSLSNERGYGRPSVIVVKTDSLESRVESRESRVPVRVHAGRVRVGGVDHPPRLRAGSSEDDASRDPIFTDLCTFVATKCVAPQCLRSDDDPVKPRVFKEQSRLSGRRATHKQFPGKRPDQRNRDTKSAHRDATIAGRRCSLQNACQRKG